MPGEILHEVGPPTTPETAEADNAAFYELVSGLELAGPWPDLTFDIAFREQAIFGSNLMPTYDDERLRGALRCMRDAVAIDSNNSPSSLVIPNGVEAVKIRNSVNLYLKSTVNWHDQIVPRGEALPFEIVRNRLMKPIRATNHPTYQVLNAIGETNSQRIIHNQTRLSDQQLPAMSERDFEALIDNVLKGVLPDEIKYLYKLFLYPKQKPDLKL